MNLILFLASLTAATLFLQDQNNRIVEIDANTGLETARSAARSVGTVFRSFSLRAFTLYNNTMYIAAGSSIYTADVSIGSTGQRFLWFGPDSTKIL